MEPVINVEETPGKTVGRRRLPAPGLDPATNRIDDARRWNEVFPYRIPKGVYRFNSHEEADEWLWKMMVRPTKT